MTPTRQTMPIVVMLAAPFDGVMVTCRAQVEPDGTVSVWDTETRQWMTEHALTTQDRARVFAATAAFLASARPSPLAGRRSVEVDDEIQQDRARARAEETHTYNETRDREDEEAFARDPDAFG